MERKILEWLANGRTGCSSKVMAFASIGIEHQDSPFHPSDPADLNRCLLLVEMVPEIKSKFPEIAKISDEWAQVISHWDELEAMFIKEVGRDWSQGREAPLTYRFMKKLGC